MQEQKKSSLLIFLSKNWAVLIIIAFAIYTVYTGNDNNDITKSNDRIDSILRVLEVAERQGKFENPSPQPTIIVVPTPGSTAPGISNDMLRAFEEMKDDNAKTRAYAEAIARKVYNNSYSDSLVDIKVNDIVEGGELKSQDVDWTIKPQKTKYYESIYYMKPKYTISVGGILGNKMGDYDMNKPLLMPTVGYTGRNGWGYIGGINLLNTKEFMFGITKDIFTKYEKIPKK